MNVLLKCPFLTFAVLRSFCAAHTLDDALFLLSAPPKNQTSNVALFFPCIRGFSAASFSTHGSETSALGATESDSDSCTTT